MTTYGTGYPIDPTDGSSERIRAVLQQMGAEGPGKLGPGLRFNRTLRQLETDPGAGGGTPQELIDARSGRASWIDQSTFIFPSLDSRLENIENNLNTASGALFANASGVYTVLTAAGYTIATSSVLGFTRGCQLVSNQVGGSSYGNSVFGSGITLGISGTNATSVLTFNTITSLQVVPIASGAGSAWHIPPAIASLTRGDLQNIAWQIAYILGYLSNLDKALKNKGIIQ